MNEFIFECNKYRTVDENDLPMRDTHIDNKLMEFKLVKSCCETLQKFNEDGDESKITMKYVIASSPLLIIDIESDSYDGGSYYEEIVIPCCPWCQTKPTLTINKMKRIKTCGERIIPAETKQICDIEVVPDN